MPGPTTLVDLPTVKDELQIASGTDDALLTRYIARATPIIERLAGPVIQRTVTNEQHIVSSGVRLALYERPVVSVTSITEYLGKVAYPVTVAADPTLTGSYGATLDADKGVLTRWATGSPRDWYRNVWVTYVTGRASVPPNVEAAALLLIEHMWATRRGNEGALPSPDDYGPPVPVAGYLVPNRVVEAIGDDLRVDGFA